MANPNKVMGQARIRVNGQEMITAPKATLELGGITRDSVEADGRAGFFSEKSSPSKMECEVIVTPGLSISALNFDDATVTFEADTGQVFVIGHGYSSETPSVNDGKCKLTIMGPPAEELLS